MLQRRAITVHRLVGPPSRHLWLDSCLYAERGRCVHHNLTTSFITALSYDLVRHYMAGCAWSASAVLHTAGPGERFKNRQSLACRLLRASPRRSKHRTFGPMRMCSPQITKDLPLSSDRRHQDGRFSTQSFRLTLRAVQSRRGVAHAPRHAELIPRLRHLDSQCPLPWRPDEVRSQRVHLHHALQETKRVCL